MHSVTNGKENNMQVPRGTIIQVGSLKRTVWDVLYSLIDNDYADIEFKDKNGNYGHYKSSYDGGKVTFPSGAVFDYENAKEV
jgi:hypothetical protein